MSWELESSIDDYGEESFEDIETLTTSSRPSALSPLSREQTVTAPSSSSSYKPNIPSDRKSRSQSPRNSVHNLSPHNETSTQSNASPTAPTRSPTTSSSSTSTRTTTTSTSIKIQKTPSASSSAPSPGTSTMKKNRIFFPDDDVEEDTGNTPSTGLPKKQLTMNELRTSMMETLTRQGVVGSLRAQLRAKMVISLKQTAIDGGLLNKNDLGPLKTNAARRGAVPLRLRVVETFLAEYLKVQKVNKEEERKFNIRSKTISIIKYHFTHLLFLSNQLLTNIFFSNSIFFSPFFNLHTA